MARSRHLPAIAQGDGFTLAGIASNAAIDGAPQCPAFSDYADLLALPHLDAVAICTPPSVRFEIARDALLAGKHVLLEKPPAVTLSEAEELRELAARLGLSIFAGWHSQFNTAVDQARNILATRTIVRLYIDWLEDVKRWHPEQAWIWSTHGLGVFDAGINALSILTRIVPEIVRVRACTLVVQDGHDAPVAAAIDLAIGDVYSNLQARFDWRVRHDRRELEMTCTDGTTLLLANSGRALSVDGQQLLSEENHEYPRLYARFGALIDQGKSSLDTEPLRLATDAFLVAKREQDIAP